MMSVIAWIIVGFAAGWITNKVMGNGVGGLLGDLIVGILSAIMGGFVMGVISRSDFITRLNLQTLLVACLGAVILSGGFRWLTTQSYKN